MESILNPANDDANTMAGLYHKDGAIDGHDMHSGGRLILVIKDPKGIPLKLFVGQLPPDWEESQIHEFFSKYGEIMDVQLIRNDRREAKRSAFVKFCSMTEAEDCIEKLQSHPITPPGSALPLEARWANGESTHLGIEPNGIPRLFVGSIPKEANEESIRDLFSNYGKVTEIDLFKEEDGSLKGFGFVRFDRKESALMAIKELNERAFISDADKPLEVRLADKRHKMVTQMARERNNPQKAAQSNPVYPGYPDQAAMYPGVGQPGPGGPAMFPQRYLQCFDAENNPYYFDQMTGQSVWGIAPHEPQPVYPGAGAGGGGGGGGQGAHHSPSKQMTYGRNKPGAQGCNLFIASLPLEWSAQDLVDLFRNCGTVQSCRIINDKGVSKGYGFLSYEQPEEAERAVDKYHGYSLPGSRKKLRVSLKDCSKEGGDKDDRRHHSPYN